VLAVLNDGYRTYDIMSEGMKKVGTKEMGDLVAAKV
jgi:3-isopropylmalate dehydrogenase